MIVVGVVVLVVVAVLRKVHRTLENDADRVSCTISQSSD